MALDPARARRIRDRLALLGQDSLYTLLATVNPTIRPSSSAADLLAAAQRLYSATVGQALKDVGVTAKAALAGEAAAIFSRPGERAMYDETLHREPMDALLTWLGDICAPSKVISQQQAESFLHEARKLGWPREAAIQELRVLAERRHFDLQLPPDM